MKTYHALPNFAGRPPAEVLPDVLAWTEFTGARQDLPARESSAPVIAYGIESVPGTPSSVRTAFRLGRILASGLLELEGDLEFTPFMWAVLHGPEVAEDTAYKLP